MEQKRYWRPQAEQILEEIDKARRMEMTRQMIKPTVIPMTELDEKIQEQIIKQVDFTKADAEMAIKADEGVAKMLRREVEKMILEMKTVEMLNELRKIIEESIAGSIVVGELELVDPVMDPEKFRKILLMSEPVPLESMVLQKLKKNEE